MRPDLQNRTVLVAGATGALGYRLCRVLVRDGWRVTGTTRSQEKTDRLRAIGVTPAVVDVFDRDALQQLVGDVAPEAVVHQLTDLPPGLDPARMPEALLRTARLRDVGTRHLVEAAVAAKAKRLIAQSIAFVYAPGPTPYSEEALLNVSAPDPVGLTTRGVASLERQVLAAPLAGVVLRYGRLYGPGTGFNEPWGGCYVHVDAAVDATWRALSRAKPGVYNVAEAGGDVSIRKAVEELGWTPEIRA